jgi:(p)ppGpp synthase/HD superfamily hydrolase
MDANEPLLSQRFREALDFSAALHARQIRKGSGIPYVSHLLAVTAIVLEYGGSEDQAIAALLHDAVEDQGGAAARAEIARRFGPEVARIVDGCSDTDALPKPPWRERKERYIAHLPSAPADERLVSAADKLHNARAILRDVRAIGLVTFERFNAGLDGTLWYYRALVQAYRAHGPHPLVDELDHVVTAIERAVAAA